MATGLYLIKDPCSRNKAFNSAKLQVRCDMETDGGGWIIIQRRITNGTVIEIGRSMKMVLVI